MSFNLFREFFEQLRVTAKRPFSEGDTETSKYAKVVDGALATFKTSLVQELEKQGNINYKTAIKFTNL